MPVGEDTGEGEDPVPVGEDTGEGVVVTFIDEYYHYLYMILPYIYCTYDYIDLHDYLIIHILLVKLSIEFLPGKT